MAIVNIEPDAAALAEATAQRIAALLRHACESDGTAHICLTGGQTPRETYRRLALATSRGTIDWERVHLFWGDERMVPPDHEDSNFGMADAALILPAGIPTRNIHRIRGELPDAEQAARDYERVLRRFHRPGRPQFDVVLLGLGADGHIASLFPGNPLLTAGGQSPLELARTTYAHLTAAVWAETLRRWRVTLTPRALLDASAILMLTAGGTKADAVKAVLQGSDDLARWPAQLLRHAGDRVEWWMDRAAAARL
jgi:6-phosphogluconolactonase